MKERVTPVNYHPIPFSTELIPPILADVKTVTRRIIKFPNDYEGGAVYDNSPYGLKYERADGTVWRLTSPYGVPGEFLWVKESYCELLFIVAYKADGKERHKQVKWKPSRFMPFHASRITLEVISVGVERLYNITEEDAKAEGVEACELNIPEHHIHSLHCYQSGFFKKWIELNGIQSFMENPWVWVIKFRRIKP